MATTKAVPLIYNEGQEQPKDKELDARYIVLGYLMYSEDDDELKMWEEFKDRRSLFDYFKTNYVCLHLLKSKVYKVYKQENNVNGIAIVKTERTAYDVIKQLQRIFINDDFNIDEEVDIASYEADL